MTATLTREQLEHNLLSAVRTLHAQRLLCRDYDDFFEGAEDDVDKLIALCLRLDLARAEADMKRCAAIIALRECTKNEFQDAAKKLAIAELKHRHAIERLETARADAKRLHEYTSKLKRDRETGHQALISLQNAVADTAFALYGDDHEQTKDVIKTLGQNINDYSLRDLLRSGFEFRDRLIRGPQQN